MTTLLTINGNTITNIKKYRVSYAKQYTDADRAMDGSLRATFIGVFPKIELEFTPVNRTYMSTLAGFFNAPSFTVVYYDVESNSTETGTFYAGDFNPELYRKDNEMYSGFTINLIPFTKRT